MSESGRLFDPRRVLAWPAAYRWFQGLLGARKARRRFLAEWAQPRSGQRTLEVGCGPGDLLAELPAGTRYVGLDIEPRYLRAAERRRGERGTFLLSRAGDAGERLRGEHFDLVLALFLLHHLDDGEARRLIAAAHDLLVPGGVLATIDPARLPGQHPLARWLIDRDRGRHVRGPEAYRALVGERFGTVETSLRGDLLRVPYTHLLMRARRCGSSTESPLCLPRRALRATPG
jgi:SAM-dependent methyltransferase